MARSDVLVSADWAENNLDTPGVVFVEVDEDTSAYDKGHIRGAVKLDWRKDLQDPVRRDFVDAEQFSKLLSDRGISNDDTVILYGGNNNWFAAYAYWYFKLYGHEKVKLLDGAARSGSWTAVRCRPTRSPARPRPTLPNSPITPSARSATRSSRPSASRTWSTSAPRGVFRQDPGTGASAAGTKPAAGSHSRRHQRAVEQGRQRRRHLQVRRGVGQDLRRRRLGRVEGDHRLLPDRRTLVAHLVCAARAARTPKRQELRRKLDRIRLPGGSPDRVGKLNMCTPPKQGQTLPASVDLEKETVITGRVVDSSGQAVGGAFVRLLDSSDEFTAEVVASATGDFRFFAAPGPGRCARYRPPVTATPW
ncbi:putative thiosulfate sulfurtransferase domain protein [Mycobacterium xenopi 3993]|nr:putative thiosulfate sulfurtransferase domain protein [Mycobacterium xenopi 3993]